MRRLRFLSWILIALLLLSGCGRGQDSYIITESLQAEEILQAAVSQSYQTPRNVVIMIADGMGPNDLILCKEKYGMELAMEGLPYQGDATTASANKKTTDSAAAATALATGSKTNNGMIGQSPEGAPLKNISEIAREQGKRIGIITTDLATGATPCGFSLHHPDREDGEALSKKMVNFAPDLLVARSYKDFKKNLNKAGEKKLAAYALAKDFEAFPSVMTQADGRPCFCFFDSLYENTLADYTKEALSYLENEEGFFLMIECAEPDKGGHAQDLERKLFGVAAFDRAILEVLGYMRNHPDTLLIITSDHESGGVRLPEKGEPLSDALLTKGGHTAANVRTFALGAGAEYFHNKTVDNTDIAKFAIAAVMEGKGK